MKRYKVTLRSAPGMWTHYSGYVMVLADCPEDAFANAVRKLALTSFPDRPHLDSWKHIRTEEA